VTDTIYALSSGSPPAGIAVIRISGPQAFDIDALFSGTGARFPRRATLRTLTDPATGAVLDRVLTLRFPGPDSATGENIAEWHCHGGRAVVRAVLDALEAQGRSGRFRLREARSGEFTRRAFENGRIDLNEAEGLADLLSAETETQRRAALLMAEGHFSRRLSAWRERLLTCAAQVESLLDFSDEDDVPGEGTDSKLRVTLSALADDMRSVLASPSAERLRDGIRLVLAGPRNAGKSTLLNALAGRDAAIVSDVAGTTRDRIEVPVDIGGVAFVMTDTAGLADDTDDAIERIGIDRAWQAVEAADLVLWLGEPGESPRDDAVRLAAQMDRTGWTMATGADLAISAATGENLGELRDLILTRARALIPGEGDYALHKRQRDAVAEMAAALDAAAGEADLLIVAEHLRMARAAMDRLTGRSGVEDMLDALFGRFCIGK